MANKSSFCKPMHNFYCLYEAIMTFSMVSPLYVRMKNYLQQ